MLSPSCFFFCSRPNLDLVYKKYVFMPPEAGTNVMPGRILAEFRLKIALVATRSLT